MMKYSRSIWSVLLSFIHATFLFAPLYIFVGDMAGLEGKQLLRFSVNIILLIIPVVLGYIMLRTVKHLFIYVLISLVYSSVTAMFGFWYGDFFKYGNVINATLNFGLSILVLIIRGYSKIEHNEMKEDFMAVHDSNQPFLLKPWEIDTFLSAPSPVHWGWFSILYLLALVMKLHYTIYTIFFVLVADAFVCFVSLYNDAFFDYLKLNTRVANMPVKTMKKAHKHILVAGILLVFLFALPAVVYHKEPLEDFSLPDRSPVAIEVEQENAKYQPNMMMQDMELLEMIEEANTHELPKWIRYLLDGILYAIGIIAVALMVGAIIRGVLNMAKSFKLEDEDEVIDLDEVDEIQESISKKTSIKEALSERAKIRRQYRKAIRKGTKGEPKRYATPSELEKDANIDNMTVYDGLHEKYEHARYSSDDKLIKKQ